MKIGSLCLVLAGLIAAGPVLCGGQTAVKNKPISTEQAAPGVRSSPAYAEILLKRTELQASLESIVEDYTDDYPKVLELKHTLGLVQKESARLAAVKASDVSKLTLALGKLVVRKVELETECGCWSRITKLSIRSHACETAR